MSFFEDYMAREIDYSAEISNIENLLDDRSKCNTSILSEIADHFLQWELRGTSVNLKGLAKQSGLIDIIEDAMQGDGVEFNEFVKYLEFVYALVRFYSCIRDSYGNYAIISAIESNLNQILDKINFEVKWIGDDYESAYPICIEKNFKAREAAEIVNDNRLAEKIFLYKHHLLEGNLFEKAIILSRLYMYFEGIRGRLEANGFKGMCDNIGQLSEKMNVRHRPKNKEELVINDFSSQDIEEIYDKLYKSYLAVIVLNDYLDDKKFLEDTRKKFS